MNRRNFIRNALAAVAGAAAGAMMPKTPVEEVVKALKYDPNAHGGPITYKLIEWIEDSECPDDMIYFINKDILKKWKMRVCTEETSSNY